MSTVHKPLFFKTTDLHTLYKKISKNILNSYKSKKSIRICRQLKYYQFRIRSETSILLEITLNAFKCLTASFPTEILISAIAPLSFISVSILCELPILRDTYILLSSQEAEAFSSSLRDRFTNLEAHSSKRLNTLSVIILVCLGNA